MKASTNASDEQFDAIVAAMQQLLREHQRWLLLIGTGPSIAISHDMGMAALRDHLLADTGLSSLDGWGEIADRLNTAPDLEQALTGINPTAEIVAAISQSTGDFTAENDFCHRDAMLQDPALHWPCANLLRQLVNRLPRNAPRQAIVTPNYDMFIEYACSAMGIRYTTGRVGGVLRSGNWDTARDALFRTEQITERGRRRPLRVPVPAVEIMKVHGSINMFRSPDGVLLESDVWAHNPPSGYERVLAAPGDLKHGAVVNNRGPFHEADPAIEAASAFLVIGYGFNDPHIHSLVERRARSGAPVILLTRDPTEALDALTAIAEHVWVLTADCDAGGTVDADRTRIVNQGYTDPLSINQKIWSADIFTSQIMGD